MARGYPDWGAMAAKETVYGLADLGEVVARLGGIQTYSRSGDMIYFDSFEHGWSNWGYSLSGTGSSAALSTSRFRSHGYSLALQPGTGVSPLVLVDKELAVLPAGPWGYEASFTLHDNGNYVEMLAWYFTGSLRLSARVRVYWPTGKISIYKADGTWADIATDLNLRASSLLFHTAKLIWNTTTKKYMRLLFDAWSYDLSAYSLREESNTDAPYLLARFYVYGDGVLNPTQYLDDIILTQNEP